MGVALKEFRKAANEIEEPLKETVEESKEEI